MGCDAIEPVLNIDRGQRYWSAGLAGLLLFACASPGRSDLTPSSRPPNLVIILADDLGWGDLGCYGGPIATPNIDALAKDGVRHLDLHSGGAVCSPTRASLMTGRYPQRAGIPGVVYADPARPEHAHGLGSVESTLPEALKDAGYATALIGKWHLGYLEPYNPLHHGFDQYRGFKSGNIDYHSHIDQAGCADWWHDESLIDEPGYLTRLLTEHALAFVDQNRERPFFLYVAHGAPHYPYQGPDDPPMRTVGGGRGPAESKQTQKMRRDRYETMIEELDASVGALRERLREQGLERDTVFLFLSDNGATAIGSNGPWRGHKGSLWEGGHRVSGLVAWPGRIPAESVTAATLHTVDVMPTFLHLAGAPAPLDLDGADVSTVWLEDAAAPKRDLCWSHGQTRAIRSGRWKLHVDGKGRGRLFDLELDPSEKRDLARSAPRRAASLRAALDSWSADVTADATPQPAH